MGDQRARWTMAGADPGASLSRAGQAKLAVNTPGDAYEREADRMADAVMSGTAMGVAESGGGTCASCRGEEVSGTGARLGEPGGSPAVLQRKANPTPVTLPWVGRIDTTWAASLRKTPTKQKDDPHGNTVADLPRNTEVEVVGINGGWLHVNVSLNGRALEGYVSGELVSYVRPSAIQFPEVVGVKTPTVAEALVELKKAQRRKAADGAEFKLSKEEKERLDNAISLLKQTGKYAVNTATLEATFARREGVKTTIETIEDFILFVEDVERQYPKATPDEVASEIRQLWFSDENWELLVASKGISQNGEQIDIETTPNPIANRYDMKTLAPTKGGFRLETPKGQVEITHVIAGIDARLSGFPKDYPGVHNDTKATIKYRTLKQQSGGDSRDFATWAGDLGQAYAEYLTHRYVMDHHSDKLAGFTAKKASPSSILGDIHGYIAVDAAGGDSGSPGNRVRVSDILREMYLIQKPSRGPTYTEYLSKVSGTPTSALKDLIRKRTINFAAIWFAKKAYEHSGWLESKGWFPGGITENWMKEFKQMHELNEEIADPEDRLDSLIEYMLSQASGPSSEKAKPIKN